MLTDSTIPIPFISFSPSKSMVLSAQALTFLSSLSSDPIHIITVAGKYRTGKSYILNRVLLQQKSGKGFEVSPTINACTKGLWIWPKIIKIDGKSCIIIDTQGLGSLQQGENTDIKIFLMAALTSSYLIYNSVGSIDEKAIQSLSLVINLANMLNKSSPFDSQDLISSFPSFLWLLRDFSLKLEDETGQPITSKDYLQNALKYHKGNTKAVDRKNQIRKQFKSFFKQRDCFTLIRPTKDEADLQNLNKLPERQLRPEFVKLIHQLRQKIAQQAPPKSLRNKPITPSTLISLIQYYTTAINNGAIPSISSHWDSLCQTQSSRIIAQCQSIYKQTLEQSILDHQSIRDQKWMRKKHVEAIMEGSKVVQASFLGKIQKELVKEKVARLFEQMFIKITENSQMKKHKEIMSIIQTEKESLQSQLQSSNFLEIMDRFIQVMQNIRNQNIRYDPFICNPLYQNTISFLPTLIHSSNLSLESQISTLKTQIQKHLKINDVKQQMIKKHKEICQSQILQIERLKSQLYNRKQLNQKKQKQSNAYFLKFQQINEENLNLKYENQELKLQINKYAEQFNEISSKLKQKSLQFQQIDQKCHNFEVQFLKQSQQLKQESIKYRKLLREKQIIKNRYQQYQQQNILLQSKLQQIQSKNDKLQHRINKENRDSLQIGQKTMDNKWQQCLYKVKQLQEEKNNLTKLLKQQKQTNEALMLAPQNLRFQALKRNSQQYEATNRHLTKKIGELSTLHTLYIEYKCSLCQNLIPRSIALEHIHHCQSLCSSFSFSVSYVYDMDKINYIIEVQYGQKHWEVTKSDSSIRLLLQKLSINHHLFNTEDTYEEEANLSYEEERKQEEERRSNLQQKRVYLQEQLNQSIKTKIWEDVFLVQYFGVDIHLQMNPNSTKKSSPSITQSLSFVNQNKAKRTPLQLIDNLEDIPINESVQLMKTSKFTKKTFKFN